MILLRQTGRWPAVFVHRIACAALLGNKREPRTTNAIDVEVKRDIGTEREYQDYAVNQNVSASSGKRLHRIADTVRLLSSR